MVNKIFKIITVLFVLVLIGCDQNPLDKLYDPTGDGALGGEWGYWKIYDDQLNTRGGVMLWPGGENQTFAEVAENPRSGTKCIKYFWNGEEVRPGEHWVAAVLIVARTGAEYGEEKNLSPGDYNKITFWVRGNLSSGTIRFEGPGTRESCDHTDWLPALPAGWVGKEIKLDNKTELLQAKEFFKIVFDGGGGTVYVDDITYSK